MSVWEKGDQPCFFNIFKQDMSKIEFEYCILDQLKKYFKMRPNKTMSVVILNLTKIFPLGGPKGGWDPPTWQDWKPCHNFFFMVFIILGTNFKF